MAFYDTFPGSKPFDDERRLGIGGLTTGGLTTGTLTGNGGVGGFPNIGYGQQQQPGYGGPGNTSEAWDNGVNRVDRFAGDMGVSRGRMHALTWGRIDARAPQAQTMSGLQTPTMTGGSSFTGSSTWNNQFQPQINIPKATSIPSWQQPGIKMPFREIQRMKAGGFVNNLPDPYA